MSAANPYRVSQEHPDAAEFYAEELTQLPFMAIFKAIAAEAPMVVAAPLAAFLRIRGYLNKPLTAQYAVGPVGSGTAIGIDDMPAPARRAIEPVIRELEEIGFSVIGYEKDNVIGAKQQYSALLLDGDEQTLTHLEWMRLPGANGMTQEFVVEFDSFATEDPEIMTGRVNPAHIALAEYIVPDFIDHLFLGRDVDLEEVFDRHVDRIETRNIERLGPDSAIARYRQCAERRFSAVKETGLLRRLRETEVALLKQSRKFR